MQNTKRQQPFWKHCKLRSNSINFNWSIKKGLDIGSKAISSEIRKKIIDKGIKYVPDLYKFGKSKMKNKNLKRALDSDIADYTVKEAQKEIFNWQYG